MLKHLKPRSIAAAVVSTLLLQGGAAHALGLRQAFEAALQNDPVFRSAFYERQAGKENEKIGVAGLLPALSANYSASKNVADTTTSTVVGDQVLHPKYNSRVAALQLRQAVFNLDGWARYRQGQAQSAYSAAQFDVQQQELVTRLTAAYIDALFAEDQVALATAQRDTLTEQRKVNDRMFQRGEGTRTDMLETQSKLDAAAAQLLEAEDNRVNTRTVLGAIIGMEVTSLDGLTSDFRIMPQAEGGLEEWKRRAVENNPELRAQKFAIEAARQEMNKNRAGHAPRVDFIASYNKTTAETINTYNQDSTVRSIGVQVSIPLYSGGGVSASTRQSAAALEKAKSDFDAKSNTVLTELRKQYNVVISSAAKIAANGKAVESAELLTVATEQSIKGGVRINLDLLNARQQLFASKRDLAQARYNYLTGVLRLRSAAGVLGPADVNEIALYFR